MQREGHDLLGPAAVGDGDGVRARSYAVARRDGGAWHRPLVREVGLVAEYQDTHVAVRSVGTTGRRGRSRHRHERYRRRAAVAEREDVVAALVVLEHHRFGYKIVADGIDIGPEVEFQHIILAHFQPFGERHIAGFAEIAGRVGQIRVRRVLVQGVKKPVARVVALSRDPVAERHARYVVDTTLPGFGKPILDGERLHIAEVHPVDSGPVETLGYAQFGDVAIDAQPYFAATIADETVPAGSGFFGGKQGCRREQQE